MSNSNERYAKRNMTRTDGKLVSNKATRDYNTTNSLIEKIVEKNGTVTIKKFGCGWFAYSDTIVGHIEIYAQESGRARKTVHLALQAEYHRITKDEQQDTKETRNRVRLK